MTTTAKRPPAPKLSPAAIDLLIARAHQAGLDAGNTYKPTPMMVRDGSQQWLVLDGACGFAWVNVKPANGQVAKALVAKGMARRDGYEGGVTVWVHQYNQSHEMKRAYAQAFARVLLEAGIQCRAGDRLD